MISNESMRDEKHGVDVNNTATIVTCIGLKMFPVFENLRAFFNSRPPLVVFIICLASFAIALITFAYIVKTKDIPDSDITQDWNSFLENFSKVDLCFSQNTSENAFVNNTGGKLSTADLSPSEIYQTLHDKFKELDIHRTLKFHRIDKREVETSAGSDAAAPSEKTDSVTVSHNKDSSSVTAKPSTTSIFTGSKFRNVSFIMNVEVELSNDKMSSMSWAESNFVTIITGEMLKMKGDLASAEMMATFTFPSNLTSRTCQTWHRRGVCQKHQILACVQLRGPQSMFPETQTPELCHGHHSARDSPSLHFMIPTLPGSSVKKEMCQRGAHMSTSFSFDESLTVLLSLHDRSIINLRLMRTSYFLFVMVVTFLCYAMVKGKRAKSKNIPYIEKVPT